jgi:hypothetical protein
MNRQLLIILVIIFVITGVGVFFISQSNPTTTTVSMQPTTVPSFVTDPEPAYDQMLDRRNRYADMYSSNPDTITITLQGVDGHSGTGIAYSLMNNGEYFHMVEATLPDPQPDTTYEGWLVNSKTGSFISTGVLQKTGEGTYMLHYQEELEDNDYAGFDKIVITLETIIDENPEVHVLTGMIM